MNLTKQHQQRWTAARSLFTRIKDAANKPGAMLIVDGKVRLASAILITETELGFKENNCTFQWFDADPECDGGLYDTSAKFAKEFRERIKVVKLVKY